MRALVATVLAIAVSIGAGARGEAFPGEPKHISVVVTPTTITCGSQASIIATVTDQFGAPVPAGFPVYFSPSLEIGTVIPVVAVNEGGVATSVFTAFPGSQGDVEIAVGSALAEGSATVRVVCDSAAGTATPIPLVCPPNLPQQADAQIVTVGSISVTLPAGRFRVFESLPNTGDFVFCHGTNAGVRLSGTTCSELGRVAPSEEENSILSQIVASCTVGAVAPQQGTRPSVRPPDTGTGGLLHTPHYSR